MRRLWPLALRPIERILAAGTVALALVGCDILEPQVAYRLPDEDLSLDPSDLRLGAFAYPCRQWMGGSRPAPDTLVVDIFFIVGGGIELQGPVDVDRPVLAHRRHVERAGGVILRTFNLAGMRVWFPTDSIPSIQEAPREAIVRLVADPRRYDVTVALTFRDPGRWKADSAQIAALGGRVVIPLTQPGAPIAAAIMPNRSLPKLRANSNVAKVIYDGYPNCGFGAPAAGWRE